MPYIKKDGKVYRYNEQEINTDLEIEFLNNRINQLNKEIADCSEEKNDIVSKENQVSDDK